MTASDMPTSYDVAAGGAEIEPSALPEHIAAALAQESGLDLLLPQDLPTEHALGAAERFELAGVLGGFLEALALPDRAAALTRIESLLAALGEPCASPAEVGDTGVPASTAQVEDFDSYFRVRRIASGRPAHALARSLLQTARANMSLFCRAPDLPQTRVAQQIAGFAGYARLLARTFDLGELS